MSNTNSTDSGRISGSIDVVVVGTLLAAAGYAAAPYTAFGYGHYLIVAGAAIAVLGSIKVAYDHATGFPNTEGE